MEDKIKQLVAENYDFFIETRRHFHRHPELSSKEFETAAYIKEHLEKWGIPYETNGVSNIVATIRGNGGDRNTATSVEAGQEKTKILAMRGDIDALPIMEETGVPYASCNPGVMHACGHDCHATYMLGTAKILNELKDELPGTVKIIFQEGEEIGVGAQKLMESRLLDDVDNIVGLHTTQEYDLGKLAIGYGIRSTFGAGVTFTVNASGGEPGQPEKGVNALVVAAEIVSAITAQASHRFAADHQVVVVPTVTACESQRANGMTSGKEQSGEGRTLPTRVKVAYNFRSLDPEDVDIFFDILFRVPEKVAELFGATIEKTYWGPEDAINNDRESTDRMIGVIRKYFGEDALLLTPGRMGGEDFSLYQRKIPGVYLHVGGATDGNYLPLHTSRTLVDDGVLPIGIELLIRYAFAYFNE